MYTFRRTSAIINIGQRILDVITLLAVTLVVGGWLLPKDLVRVLSIYGSLLLMVVFSFFNMYQPWRRAGIGEQLRLVALAWAVVLLVFNSIILLLSNEAQFKVLWPYALFRTSGFNLWALSVFTGLAAVRICIRVLLSFLRGRGYSRQSAIIIGAGVIGKKLARYLAKNRWMGINLLGFFDDKIDRGTPVLNGQTHLGNVIGPIQECREYAAQNNVQWVFLALPLRAEAKINRIVGELGTRGFMVLMVQDLLSFGIHRAKIHNLGELQLMDFYLFPVWKRIFDVLFSLFMIVATFPFWLVVMAVIKLEDGGPIFFKHPRVTESGKCFDCLKFRTMRVHDESDLDAMLSENPQMRAEWEEMHKLKNDPRVTTVGRYLRKFSLDELPQFINVLTGDMSVVGARPVVPAELEKHYKEATLTYCAMKPGITGLWQVKDRSDTPDYETRVELDRWYILNCSLLLDLKIIMTTIWKIATSKGAY